MTPQQAALLVGHHPSPSPAVERAREQAKYQTDPRWAAALIERALKETPA